MADAAEPLEPPTAGAAPSLTPIQIQKLKDYLGRDDVPADVKARLAASVKARYFTPGATPLAGGEPQVELAPEAPGALGSLRPVPTSEVIARGIQRGAVAGAEGLAAVAAPELLPARAGAGLAVGALRALGRSLLSGGAAVGVDVAERGLRGAPQSSEAAIAKFIAAAGPQAVAEIASPIVYSLAERASIETALQQTVPRAERTAAATEGRVASLQTRVDEARAVLDAARVGEVGAATETGGQAIAEGAAAQRVAGATEGVVAAPVALGGRPATARTLGSQTQTLLAKAETSVERKRRTLYDAEVAAGERAGLRTQRGAELASDLTAIQEHIARLESEGLTQSAALKRRIGDVLDRAAPYIAGSKTERTPLTLSYRDVDEIREYLQGYVRPFGARGRTRSADQGAIGTVMAKVDGILADMRRGVEPVEQAARKANAYYVHHVVPTRDAAGAAKSQMQPSQAVRGLLAPGQEDRLIKTLQLVPREHADRLRAGLLREGLERTASGEGLANPDAFLKWWDSFTPRQQAALSGGDRTSVRRASDALREALQDRDALAEARKLVDRQRVAAASARRASLDAVERAESRLTVGQAGAEAARAEVGRAQAVEAARTEKRALKAQYALAGGVGGALAAFLSGHPHIALATLASSAAGYGAFAAIAVKPEATQALATAIRARRGSLVARKAGAQVALQLVAEGLTAQIEALNDEDATRAPAAAPPTP